MNSTRDFAKIAGLITCLLALTTARLSTGAGELPRSTPEAQGISSSAILDFIETADKKINSLHSFMLVRHGNVVAEGWWSPYDAPLPHMLFSLSKSFASTAVGLAVAEGKLSVDDPVLKFFPDEAPENPDNNLKAMRVRDLLRMNTGHETEPPRQPDQSWKEVFLKHPVRFKPGTHFLYNTSASYMLAAIVEKTTGMPLMDFLRPRLFDPLGIENPVWDKSPEGIALGGYGLNIRTEDIARFGQLYLQKGKWNGKQLLPAAWVEEATSYQTSNGSNPKSDWDQGYGYQFWRCRNNAYRGDGAFGQYCIVLPEKDAVIAITSGLGDMQSVLDLVWEKLLPAMKDSTLPSNEAAHQSLVQKLKSLKIPLQAGNATSSAELFGKTYTFPENLRKLESIALEKTSGGAPVLVVRFAGKEQRIECGQGSWKKGRTAWASQPERSVAASGGWTAGDTFTAKLCFYEAPFIQTVRLTFADGTLRFNSEANVGFGRTKEPELVGTPAKLGN